MMTDMTKVAEHSETKLMEDVLNADELRLAQMGTLRGKCFVNARC